MLELKNISKIFNKGRPYENIIFKNLNLTIPDGTFVTIIGGNGTGKSTLINLIAGSISPDLGTIILDNKDITFMPEFKRAKFIGRVFQNPLQGTAPNLTVKENLYLAMFKNSKQNLFSRITPHDKKLFKEKLAKLGLELENSLNTKMRSLSGGQRQAITLLMATMSKPRILLLDEHTAALDPTSCDKILDLTKTITNNSNIITLMITHDMDIIKKMNTKVIKLENSCFTPIN